MRSALFLLLTTVLVPGQVSPKPKLTVSESLRFETMTKSSGGFGSSWSETNTASRSKLNTSAELPIDGERIDGATRFEMKVGDFSFESSLKDDPKFQAGASSVRLLKTSMADAKGNRLILAKVELKWSGDRLTAKIASDSPNTKGAFAMAFKDGQVGAFEGLTKASITFGSRKYELDVPIRGKIGRKTVDVEGLSGGATTVELKGEASGT
jgi:hypothetical protein